MQPDAATSPKTLQDWLDQYGESHTDPINIALHKLCVPAIFWSLLGMLAGIPHWTGRLLFGIVCLGGLLFYARLNVKIFFIMVIVLSLCEWSYSALLAVGFPLFWVSTLVFAVAWVGQFIGHNIEGKKPSFLEDLQFLLIGPIWVVYSMLPR